MTKKIVANPEVVSFISDAVESAQSTYAYMRLAADGAADQIDIRLPIQDALPPVLDLYSEYFKDDHNLKAIFKDLLTLHYSANAPITFEKGKGEKATEVHTTGEQATKLPKDDMRKAATALRADLGIGRKSGGGRKANAGNGKGISVKSVIENLLKSKDGEQALRDILKAQGYQLRKVSK